MKNVLKVIITLIIILILMCQISITYASNKSDILGGESTESFNPSSGASAGTGYFKLRANKVVGLIRNIGIVVAVIALMAIGLKEMTASVEEKSNLKKALPVYILGVIMVVAITVLPSIIYNVTTGKKSQSTASTTTSKSGGTKIKDIDSTKMSNEVIAKAIQAGLAFLKEKIEMYVYDEPQDAGLVLGSEIGEDEEVTWQSSNNKVATVVDGKVYAEGIGTATITATAGGKSARLTVEVKARPVELKTLSLSSSSKKLEVGETSSLTLTIFPSDSTDKTVTWTSSDENIVKISSNKTTTNTATITIAAIKEGSAIVTASSTNGKNAICSVKVTKRNEANLNDNSTSTSLQNLSFENVIFKKMIVYDTGKAYNYIQAMDYCDGYYYVCTSNQSDTGPKNSIIKFDSNFRKIKEIEHSTNKITGICVSADKKELIVSLSKKNMCRVFDPNTLKRKSDRQLGKFGTTVGVISYDRSTNQYAIKSGKIFSVLSSDGKVIKKINAQSGVGQDICIAGDYILDLTYDKSIVNIYSISQGKFLRAEKIQYEGNVVFGKQFEPEGICRISNNEFIIGVATKNSRNHRCVTFYKGTLKN